MTLDYYGEEGEDDDVNHDALFSLDQIGALPFPALYSLSLTTPYLHDAVRFARSLVKFPPTLRICVAYPENDSIEDVEDFFALLQSHSTFTLERLTMYLSGATLPEEPPVTLHTIQPLMRCRSLVSLSLHLARPVKLTDADMMSMVPSWPSLTHFSIQTRAEWVTSPGVSLDGLLAFTVGLPNLARFGAPLFRNHTASMLTQAAETANAQNSKLWWIEFEHDSFDDSCLGTVIFILGLTFPKLQWIHRTKRGDPRWHDDRTEQIVSAFQMLRQAEKDGECVEWRGSLRERMSGCFDDV